MDTLAVIELELVGVADGLPLIVALELVLNEGLALMDANQPKCFC